MFALVEILERSYTRMRRIRAILQKLAIESLQMFLANFRCAFHQHLEVAGCSFLTRCPRNVQLGKQAASLNRSSSPSIDDILKLVALVLEMQHKKNQNFTNTCNFSRHCLWLPPARQAQHQGPAMGCCAPKGTRRAMPAMYSSSCIWRMAVWAEGLDGGKSQDFVECPYLHESCTPGHHEVLSMLSRMSACQT